MMIVLEGPIPLPQKVFLKKWLYDQLLFNESKIVQIHYSQTRFF